MSDPFKSRCVHGVWPLVADPGAPGGIRFADLDADAPEDCLASPSGLPDAAVEIRLFRSAEALGAWCEAAAEFGGNAVSARPLGDRDLHAALLVRFDRDRAVGETLDDCVAVSGDAGRDPAEARARGHARRRSETAEARWKAAWAAELAAVEAGHGLRLDPMSGPMDDRLLILTRDGDGTGSILVMRDGDGRLVSAKMAYAYLLEDDKGDIAQGMLAAVARGGFEHLGDGRVGRRVPVADAAAIAAFRRDMKALSAEAARANEERTARGIARDAAGGRPGAILRRMAEGFPLAYAGASSTYAYQVNPVSGHAVDVDSYAVERLLAAGAIRPAWWSGRVPSRGTKGDRLDKALDAFEASVWVPTPSGLALASGAAEADPAGAARGVSAGREALREAVLGDGASPDLAEIAGAGPAPASWEPPADAPSPPAWALQGARLPKRAKDLALLAAWVRHGIGAEDAPAPRGP